MKNVTPTTTSKITPLSYTDLSTIFGGSDEVLDPSTILGDTSVIVEDLYEI